MNVNAPTPRPARQPPSAGRFDGVFAPVRQNIGPTVPLQPDVIVLNHRPQTGHAEAHIPAKRQETQEQTWIPGPHEDEERPGDLEAAPEEGPPQAHGERRRFRQAGVASVSSDL